jgi:hypothetical protein
MAGRAAAWRNLRSFDSLVAVAQVLWQNLVAFLASGIGGLLMGYLASITGWLTRAGPVVWGGVGLISFIGLQLTFSTIRRQLAASRKDKAAALIAEQVADRSTINPMEKHFRNQRIHVQDLFTPYGEPVTDRTFADCDIIGPAVVLVDRGTVIRRNNLQYVEFVCVEDSKIQVWPNKLTLFNSIIESCRLYNVIFLVPRGSAEDFQRAFTDNVPWVNSKPPAPLYAADDTPVTPSATASQADAESNEGASGGNHDQ